MILKEAYRLCTDHMRKKFELKYLYEMLKDYPRWKIYDPAKS